MSSSAEEDATLSGTLPDSDGSLAALGTPSVPEAAGAPEDSEEEAPRTSESAPAEEACAVEDEPLDAAGFEAAADGGSAGFAELSSDEPALSGAEGSVCATDAALDDASADDDADDASLEALVRGALAEDSRLSRSATLCVADELCTEDETEPSVREQAQRAANNRTHIAVHKTAARFTLHTSFQFLLETASAGSARPLCVTSVFCTTVGTGRAGFSGSAPSFWHEFRRAPGRAVRPAGECTERGFTPLCLSKAAAEGKIVSINGFYAAKAA